MDVYYQIIRRRAGSNDVWEEVPFVRAEVQHTAVTLAVIHQAEDPTNEYTVIECRQPRDYWRNR